MIFTELQKKHIKNLLALVWKVFKEFNGKDCSEEGIEEFKNFIEYECVLERFYKGELKFYGAIDNDNLIGVIATKNINHICLLFIDKNYHKKGIGKKLFKMVEDVCKTKNIIKITVNSSPYSVSFYKKIGFTVKNKEKTINGIRFIPMEYLINNISLKLFTYLKAKEKNCNKMLKDNYENNEKNLKEIKNIINIVQKVKKYLNLYILNEKKLNEKTLLKLLDYLIIISKDNIKHLVKCSSIIRNQNFSNITFINHVPACVNLTIDFKCMNECILSFSKELENKYRHINFRKKINLLEDIIT